jgi:peroxiredoxin
VIVEGDNLSGIELEFMNLKLTTIAICGLIFTLNLINIADIQAQYKANKKKQSIPEFHYETLSGKDFGNENLKRDNRLMIVYFNPVCEICHREIKDILDNINYFQDIEILMISPAPKEEVVKFGKRFKLNNYHQITLLFDKYDVFYKQFGAVGYPTLYMYDKNKDLILSYDTEVEFSDIRDAFSPEMARKK